MDMCCLEHRRIADFLVVVNSVVVICLLLIIKFPRKSGKQRTNFKLRLLKRIVSIDTDFVLLMQEVKKWFVIILSTEFQLCWWIFPIGLGQCKCLDMNNLLKLLSVGLMLHPHFFRPATAQENCSGSTQIFINAALATANQDDGSLEVQGGFVYPPGFWKDENGNYTGCPCMIKKCIAHCSSEWRFFVKPGAQNSINISVCVDFVHESARSKQLLLQVLPSYHHYHHHGSEKNISHNESSLILMDHGNSTDDFFEIFYPIDEETNADAQYIEHNNVHQRPLSRQDIIDHHHRSERICFLIQNQVKLSKLTYIEKRNQREN